MGFISQRLLHIFQNTIVLIFTILFIIWICISVVQILRKSNNKSIYEYIYNSIPSVFTTLGILGTFVGIFVGLQDFDVHDITNSIPTLLEGMKSAFLTSIIGLILSIIFGKISQVIAEKSDKKQNLVAIDDELGALKEIISEIKAQNKQSSQFFTDLKTQSKNIAENTSKQVKLQEEQNKNIPENNKFLSEIKKEIINTKSENIKSLSEIKITMIENSKKVERKFEEFSELLRRNNTEALVEVMKKVTEEFNKQMSSLINKLVQENFEELNLSIQNLNTWQQENKQMIATLTQQFTKVSKDFEASANFIKEITKNTEKLVDNESHLQRLIKELQKVMIDDTKFTQITNKISDTVNVLQKNTQAFDESTNKLNNWVKNQMNFTDSVAVLINKLEDVKNIKDINEVFWKNFEEQLNTSMAKIEEASQKFTDDLEEIDNHFYDRLNNVLQNFDNAIQRILKNNDL